MTLDISDTIQSPHSNTYLGKSKMHGLYSTKNKVPFNQTDIKRNQSMAAVVNTPKLFQTAKKDPFGEKTGIFMDSQSPKTKDTTF